MRTVTTVAAMMSTTATTPAMIATVLSGMDAAVGGEEVVTAKPLAGPTGTANNYNCNSSIYH